MSLTGRTDSLFRRYDIVSAIDLKDAARRLDDVASLEAGERLIRLGLLGSQSFDTCQGIKLLASVEMVQESVVVPTARALAHNNRSVTKSTT